jgi:hypothetical protein
MDLYSLIKNKVMGVLDKQKNKQKQAQLKAQQLTQLTDVELKLVYSITAKLQNQLKK